MRFVWSLLLLLEGATPAIAFITSIQPGRIAYAPSFSLADNFEDGRWEDRYDVVSVLGTVAVSETNGALQIDSSATADNSYGAFQLFFNRALNPSGDFHASIQLALGSNSSGDAEGSFVILTDPANEPLSGEVAVSIGQSTSFLPSGEPYVSYFVRTSTPGASEIPFEVSALPDVPYTLRVDYDAPLGVLTFSIAELGFTKAYAVAHLPEFLLGFRIESREAVDILTGQRVPARGVFSVDNLETDLTATVFRMDYTPLSYGAVAYDDTFNFDRVRDNGIYVKEFFSNQFPPFTVSVSNTVVSLSGAQNLTAYLLSLDDGARVTVYSASSPEEVLAALEDNMHLDVYVPDIFVANGAADYTWNLQANERGRVPGSEPPPPTPEEPPTLPPAEPTVQQVVDGEITIQLQDRNAIVFPSGKETATLDEVQVLDPSLYEALVNLGVVSIRKESKNTFVVTFSNQTDLVGSALGALQDLSAVQMVTSEKKIWVGAKAFVFTPNGDGVGDYLQVPVLYALPASQAIVASKYGKAEAYVEVTGYVEGRNGEGPVGAFTVTVPISTAAGSISGMVIAQWDGLLNGAVVGEGFYSVEFTTRLTVKPAERSTIEVAESVDIGNINVGHVRLSASGLVTPRDGGFISVGDASDPLYGASIYIPPGTVSEYIYFSISTSPTALQSSPLDTATGQAVSFGPDFEFSNPVTIAIPYDKDIAYRLRYREASIGLATLFESNWVPVTNVTVDIFVDRVYATVSHFSDYTPSANLTAWGAVLTNMQADFENSIRGAVLNARMRPDGYKSSTYAPTPLGSALSAVHYYYLTYSQFAHYQPGQGRKYYTPIRTVRFSGMDELILNGINGVLNLLASEAINYHQNAGVDESYADGRSSYTLMDALANPAATPFFLTFQHKGGTGNPRGWGLFNAPDVWNMEHTSTYPDFALTANSTGYALNGLLDFSAALGMYILAKGNGNLLVKDVMSSYENVDDISSASKVHTRYTSPFFELATRANFRYKLTLPGKASVTTCTYTPTPSPTECLVNLETLTMTGLHQLLLDYASEVLAYWDENMLVRTGLSHSGVYHYYFVQSNWLEFNTGIAVPVNVLNMSNVLGMAAFKYGIQRNSQYHVDIARNIALEFRSHWGVCTNYGQSNARPQIWPVLYDHSGSFPFYDNQATNRGEDFEHSTATVNIIEPAIGRSFYSGQIWKNDYGVDVFSSGDIDGIGRAFLQFLTYEDGTRWGVNGQNVIRRMTDRWLINGGACERKTTRSLELGDGALVESSTWPLVVYDNTDVWEVNMAWLEYGMSPHGDYPGNRGGVAMLGLAQQLKLVQEYYDGQRFIIDMIAQLAFWSAECLLLISNPLCPSNPLPSGCSLAGSRGSPFDALPIVLVLGYLYHRRRNKRSNPQYLCLLILFLSTGCKEEKTVRPQATVALPSASPTAQRVELQEPIVEVAAGNTHVCALAKGGSVFCWGGSRSAISGLGNGRVDTEKGTASPTAVDLESRRAVTISSGLDRSCAALEDGTLTCWGAFFYPPTVPYDGRPIDLLKLPGNPTAIFASGSPCLNSGGEFGCYKYPNTLTINTAAGMPESTVAFSASTTHDCVLTSSGDVYCVGTSYHAVLGKEPVDPSHYTRIDGVSALVEVATGVFFTCVIDSSRNAWCWGLYDKGQLGNGTGYGELGEGLPYEMDSFGLARPSKVANLGPISQVAVGRAHACAIVKNSEVHCWGANDFGQIGDGTRAACYSSDDRGARGQAQLYQCRGNRVLPEKVEGLPATPIQVSLGEDFSCALLDDHSVWCWGSQEFGVVPNDP